VVERPKVGFAFDYGRYLEGAVRPQFLAEGLLSDVVPPDSPAWRDSVGRFGPWSLPLWMGEVWCRTLLQGERAEAVEEALWTDPGAG